MRLAIVLILVALALPAVLLAAPRAGDPPAPPPPAPAEPRQALPPVTTPKPAAPLPPVERAEREPQPPSKALGKPFAGRLVNGRALPRTGPGYITWDPIHKAVPNRRWRTYGTGRLVRTIEKVLAAYARRHPDAPAVLVGDLSRPRGGDFGPRFGGIGHASHQNGLDADVYYPRRDGELRAPRRPADVDMRAAQELVDAFVAAGAELVFVGPSLDLRGPPDIVQPLVHHDDHLHVRLPGQ